MRWPTASPRCSTTCSAGSEEPFWQQAYTNLVKFIILLHKVVDDYVTLFDVYECAINPDRIAERLAEGEQQASPESGHDAVASRRLCRRPRAVAGARRIPRTRDRYGR